MKRVRESLPIAMICRNRRIKLDLTQAYLSWKSGISSQLFSQFEQGKNNSLAIFLIYEPFLTKEDWDAIRNEVELQNNEAKRNLANKPKANQPIVE